MRRSCTRLPPQFAKWQSCCFPRWFVQTDFLFPAFDFEGSAVRESEDIRASTHGVFGHQDPRNAFGQAFDAAGEIHRVTDRGVLALVIRADQADDRRPECNPMPTSNTLPSSPSSSLKSSSVRVISIAANTACL